MNTRWICTVIAPYVAKLRLLHGGRLIGPGNRCVICGKQLTDPESITRAIGSECWQTVLKHLGEETQ